MIGKIIIAVAAMAAFLAWWDVKNKSNGNDGDPQ